MNDFFKETKHDKVISNGFIISFILVVIASIYILFYYSSLPPFIPLFNELPWGNNRLGIRIMIFIPVIIVFGVSLLNIINSEILYKRAQIVSRVLAITSLLIAFLSFLFIVRTVQLII